MRHYFSQHQELENFFFEEMSQVDVEEGGFK